MNGSSVSFEHHTDCTVVCCSVLQCAAACCSTSLCSLCVFSVSFDLSLKKHCNTLQHAATLCNMLHQTVHCNTPQHTLQHTLQRTATHCNTLQHTATHCVPAPGYAGLKQHLCREQSHFRGPAAHAWPRTRTVSPNCNRMLTGRAPRRGEGVRGGSSRRLVCLRHDSFIRVTRLIDTCDMTPFEV